MTMLVHLTYGDELLECLPSFGIIVVFAFRNNAMKLSTETA
jgi:hypothetical protein